MGKLVLGLTFLFVAFLTRTAGVAIGSGGTRTPGAFRAASLVTAVIGVLLLAFSTLVVIGPGSVGVRHAFGYVDPDPLLSGIRIVTPWSSVERFSTREEQFPEIDRPEEIDALSSEQMGMKVDVEVLHDMRSSNNIVLLVPTEGGLPVLNLAELRRNPRQP